MALPSVELNSKLGSAELSSAGGPTSIVTSGATLSTVQVYVAGVASTLPAPSVARTWNVWLPSARPA
ncbi:MAG: hypothetical protein H6709_14225 [Kofleriaceae bacterium]|nr:hypothetical protein [Kofleriaceae bacterium]